MSAEAIQATAGGIEAIAHLTGKPELEALAALMNATANIYEMVNQPQTDPQVFIDPVDGTSADQFQALTSKLDDFQSGLDGTSSPYDASGDPYDTYGVNTNYDLIASHHAGFDGVVDSPAQYSQDASFDVSPDSHSFFGLF
ncbi:MAG: hypothetical protein AAF703_17445 [Cyanobacteria bacterium P01_D01_bin.105]